MPFKRAQSHNPVRRPAKLPISDAYLGAVETELPDKIRLALQLPVGSTYGAAIAFGQGLAAVAGKTDAAREIREAIEGKAGQRIEAAGPDNCKVVCHVVYENQTKPSPPTERPVNSKVDESA